jgi:hypothetical protein
MRRAEISDRAPKSRPAALSGLLAAAFILAGAALGAQSAPAPAPAAQPAAGAQGASASGSGSGSSESEDDMFGSPETVTRTDNVSKEAQGQSDFLKYDQVKVGGSFTSKVGLTSAWASPWNGSGRFLPSTSDYVTPDIQGDVTIVAKPLTDFGVNMDFRTSWPFTVNNPNNNTVNVPNIATASLTSTGTGTIPNIAVWSLYSKFNWQDKVYFSAGLQPLSWGVSKGYFQPADDIFATSTTIDPANPGAERQGPISIKTTIPLGVTNNLYVYAGLPTTTGASGSTNVSMDPGDARIAVKGEYGFGNTELALGGYYSYNDHPRALLMGTTGTGSWNFFGEGILKYGSERYFLSDPIPSDPPAVTGAQQSGDFYFSGTIGGYYFDADSRVTIMLQYYYNGEGQTGVNAQDALDFYVGNPGKIDTINFGTHYAFASFSDTDLFSQALGADKLGASLIVISNLSDLSGYVIPSVSWKFFDYMSLQFGATFSFGQAGGEYITYGVGQPLNFAALPSTPGAALNLTLTVGSGIF